VTGTDQANDTDGAAGIDIATGVGLGLILGMMFDHVGLGIALGFALRLVFGSVAELSKKDTDSKE
jgi:hypothetical protein